MALNSQEQKRLESALNLMERQDPQAFNELNRELERLAGKNLDKNEQNALDQSLREIISGFSEDAQKAPSSLLGAIGEGAGSLANEIGDLISRFGSAPTREALDAALKGGGLSGAASGFAERFGSDPNAAPTGRELIRGVKQNAEEAFGSQRIKILLGPDELERFKVHMGNLPSPFIEERDGLVIPANGFDALLNLPNEKFLGVMADIGADITNFINPIGFLKTVIKGVGQGGAETVGFFKGVKKIAEAMPDAGAVLGAIKEAVLEPSEARQKLSSLLRARPGKRSPLVEGVVQAFESARPTRQGVVPGFEEITQFLKEKGIKATIPSEIEFGPSSRIARTEKQIRGTIVGERRLLAKELFGREIDKAIMDEPGKITAADGFESHQEAGSWLIDAFKDSIDDFFKTISTTYKETGKILNPDGRMKPAPLADDSLDIIKRAAGKLQKRVRQANQVVSIKNEVIGATRETAKKLIKIDSYEQLAESLENLGAFAFDPKNARKTEVDMRFLRDTYFDLRDALYTTVESYLGPIHLQELVDSNKKLTEMIRNKGFIDVIENPRVSPEKIWRDLVLRSDTKSMKALGAIIGQDNMEIIRRGLLDDILAQKGGKLQLGKSLNNFTRHKERVKQLFSPSELKDLDDLMKIRVDAGTDTLNLSRTQEALDISNSRGVVSTALRSILGDTGAFVADLPKTLAQELPLAVQKGRARQPQRGLIEFAEENLGAKPVGAKRILSKGLQAFSVPELDENRGPQGIGPIDQEGSSLIPGGGPSLPDGQRPAANGVTTEDIQKRAASIQGTMAKFKIPRSTQEMIDKKELVYAKLFTIDPTLATQFMDQANGNPAQLDKTIPLFISEMGHLFEPSKYATEFNGKLHSKQDKFICLGDIEKDPNLGSVDKAKRMNDVNRDGTIQVDESFKELYRESKRIDMARDSGIKMADDIGGDEDEFGGEMQGIEDELLAGGSDEGIELGLDGSGIGSVSEAPGIGSSTDGFDIESLLSPAEDDDPESQTPFSVPQPPPGALPEKGPIELPPIDIEAKKK